MKTIGRVTPKQYRCIDCGHESSHSTNHYGEIYPRCRACGWKNPMKLSQVHECLETLPEGWDTPVKWTEVKLGDVIEIIGGK